VSAHGDAARGASGADRRFREYLADDWRQWMVESPETATVLGFPGQDDRWTDDSPDGIAARRRHLEESAARLGAFDPATLSAPERMNYRLYDNLLALAKIGVGNGDDALPFHFGWPRNLYVPMHQMEGIHLTVGQILPLQPRVRVADVEAIVARLRALPVAVEQDRALLEVAKGKGIVPPRVAIRGLPDQVAALVPESADASAIFEPFRDLPETIAASDRDRLTEAARAVYDASVRPAFQRLHRYLVDEYLPAARETIALSDLPNGRAIYDHRVRWTTTTGQTAEQIHAVGLAEVHRIRAAMETLVRSTGFAGTILDFYAFLRSDPQFRVRTPEELVDRFRVIAKRIDPELGHRFGTLPRLPYGVQPVPDYSAPSSPGAYYQPGAPSTGRAGTFFANTYDLPSRGTWRMEALTLHEAVPGHHLQIAIAAEMQDVPEFRKHSGETAFVEGWGLYAESLGDELGMYKDPYAKFGYLDFDMWRSIRLVVDTGMHALGWSRDRAIQFFRENTGMSDLDIAVEVDRYIMIPAQALAYKIGQLKIRELRTYAEAALGERFDERAYHDVVLAEGGIPLGELEARVRAWVDRERSASKVAA
jgi:uncharacterized protein (DUF885 family)